MVNEESVFDVPACGSLAERRLQHQYGTTARAQAFYRNQMLDHLNPAMRQFLARQEMMFISTADAEGEADCSFRAGLPGFVRVLDERSLCYPEYRGNGVMASLSNIAQTSQVGLLFVDFMAGKIGLHVNGRARIAGNSEVIADPRCTPEIRTDLQQVGGRRPERWVLVHVQEAYIHCSKHIPRLRRLAEGEVPWGTDDDTAKGGDYFGVRAGRRSSQISPA